MKYKWAIFSLAVIAGGLAAWALRTPHRPVRVEPAAVAKDAPATDFIAAAGQKDGLSAERYLNTMANDEHSANASLPESATDIVLWERRIQSYAEKHYQDNIPPDQLHSLARKTADLIQMLDTAVQRQKAGLEPYTGLSGFNTMAAVMALEKEFQETVQSTFADFLYAQDEELIKGLF